MLEVPFPTHEMRRLEKMKRSRKFGATKRDQIFNGYLDKWD